MAKETKDTEVEITITDPEVYQPKAKPMLVSPGEGKQWKNKEQEIFAKFVNDFAYESPDRFAKDKATLIKNLNDIGADPGEYYRLAGLANGGPAVVVEQKVV